MKIELMAPAKNMENLYAAINAGADSIYLGFKEFNARCHSQNFEEDEFCEAVRYVHQKNKKAYLTLNTLLKENEIEKAMHYAQVAIGAGIDAIIIQDLALSVLLSGRVPLIASTQMTICNHRGVEVVKELGFIRVVLARELNIHELKEIANKINGIELEVFIHGGLCIGYSGQCSASTILYHAAANRGIGKTPCWEDYTLYQDGQAVRSGKLIRPKDMFGLDHIKQLYEMGITAFKIQGRTRSVDYIKKVVSVYRKYINLVEADSFQVDPNDIATLYTVSERGLMRGNLETCINTDFVVNSDCATFPLLSTTETEATYGCCENAEFLTVVFNSLNFNVNEIKQNYARIYLPYELFTQQHFEIIKQLQNHGPIYLIMPIIMERNSDIYETIPAIVEKFHVDGISIANLSDLMLLGKIDTDFVGERNLNVTNHVAADFFKAKGLTCLSLPFELTNRECSLLNGKANIDFERTVYGRPIIMQMKYCLLMACNECPPECKNCLSKSNYYLNGRNKFIVECNKQFTRTILRLHRKLALPVLNQDTRYIRLEFTDEDVDQINIVSSSYAQGFYPIGEYISEIGSV